MIDSDGNVKLLDMNAAKQNRFHEAQDTNLIGTVGYAAPEQYGFGSSEPGTDIYSIGVLLNEMITGVFPNERMPEGRIGDIIRKCTKMDPQDRYRSARELLEDLQGDGFLQESPVSEAIPQPKNKNAIPGFRTGNPVHMVIAIVGYFLMIVLAMSLTVQGIEGGILWFNRIMCLISEIMIVIVSCNYRNIWNRLGISKNQEKWKRILKICIIDAVIFVGIIILTTEIEGLLLR